MVVGLLVGAAGFALLVDVDASTGYGSLIARLLLIPAGVGVAVPSMTATVLSSAPRNRSALAAGVLNTVRQAAGAVGVAAFGALAAKEMLAGMRLAFGLSAALLAGAGVLSAWSVRPAGQGERDAAE
jgi:DHA2 family methylenomycin A resistance protein-like MFS transporter